MTPEALYADDYMVLLFERRASLQRRAAWTPIVVEVASLKSEAPPPELPPEPPMACEIVDALPAEDDWLTIAEACAYAKVHRRTMHNWLRAHKLRTVKTVGGKTRIAKASLFLTPDT